MNYSDRLKACKLPTLHYRRIRGDMIETYKLLTGKFDIETAPSLVTILGWGWFLSNERSQLEITKNRTKYDLCKFCFANRMVGLNKLFGIHCLVMCMGSAETVNCFKL